MATRAARSLTTAGYQMEYWQIKLCTVGPTYDLRAPETSVLVRSGPVIYRRKDAVIWRVDRERGRPLFARTDVIVANCRLGPLGFAVREVASAVEASESY